MKVNTRQSSAPGWAFAAQLASSKKAREGYIAGAVSARHRRTRYWTTAQPLGPKLARADSSSFSHLRRRFCPLNNNMVVMALLCRKIICCGPMLEYKPTRISNTSIIHRRAAKTLLPHFRLAHQMQLQMMASSNFQVGIHTKLKRISMWIMEGIVGFRSWYGPSRKWSDEMNS